MKTDQTKVFFNYQEPNVIKAIAKNVETNAVIASREVKLRHGDKPDKRIGRTYAFRKLMNHALENNLIPKQEINVLWKQFGNTCKQPNVKLAY